MELSVDSPRDFASTKVRFRTITLCSVLSPILRVGSWALLSVPRHFFKRLSLKWSFSLGVL
jgi:hypothetical protein